MNRTKGLSPQRRADLEAWSRPAKTPQQVQAEWDRLSFAAPVPLAEADYPTLDDLLAAVTRAERAERADLSEPMQAIARVLEDAGLTVTVLDGVIYADDVAAPDPQTGIPDCRASFRITQEA